MEGRTGPHIPCLGPPGWWQSDCVASLGIQESLPRAGFMFLHTHADDLEQRGRFQSWELRSVTYLGAVTVFCDLKLGAKYIDYLFAELFYKVRADSEQDLSEDIMVLSENAACEKMEATTPSLQSTEEKELHPSFHVAQENRHQEIWSVLEGVWNTMNLYRYSLLKGLRTNT